PPGHHAPSLEDALRRFTDSPKRGRAPTAYVDPPTPAAAVLGGAVPVEATTPVVVSAGAVLRRPLAFEQRLGAAVPALLAEVRRHAAAAVVPDTRAWMEADPVARVEQPPA